MLYLRIKDFLISWQVPPHFFREIGVKLFIHKAETIANFKVCTHKEIY